MENLEIAQLLDELADLLEIQGANPFRVRAYRNAAETVKASSRALADLVDEGADLTSLQGVGKDLARQLEALVQTGKLPRLEEVSQEVPRSLATLTRLPGVGPKKVKKLWDELDVTTVDELEAAAQAGRLEALDGFGKKSQEKILRAVADLRQVTGRFKISEVERLTDGLVEHTREAPGVERLERVGSFRRRRETVGDVDLLVQLAPDGDGQAVVDHFASFAGAERVEAQGSTKGSLILRSGLQVDLRVIPAQSWGAALHYFSGSKDHNVRVRQLAQRKGLRVNEWGVWRLPEDAPAGADAADDDADPGPADAAPADPTARFGERVGGATEDEVFTSVGLPFIPPELRENRGEIEAGLEGRLPELVTLEDIRGDLQMHSTWSDGENTLEEMALACRERGYEYMAITDHSPSLAMVQGLTAEKARRQWDEIDQVRQSVEGFHVFRSIEADILRDGTLDMDDDVLAGMDLVLISVHSFMDLAKTEMTERVLRAMEHPAVDILAHPTGRLIGKRKSFELDVEAVLQRALELDVAVELNASPNRLDLSDVHVRRAKELGVPVVISTDAHRVRGLDVMRYGVAQARRGWLEAGDVLNTRCRADFERWLGRREEGAA